MDPRKTPLRRAPQGGPGPTQAVQIQAPRGEREKGEGEEEDKGRREKGRKG